MLSFLIHNQSDGAAVMESSRIYYGIVYIIESYRCYGVFPTPFARGKQFSSLRSLVWFRLVTKARMH